MRRRRVRAQIVETAIEARVRLEDAACVSGASGAEQKDGCFFDAEHGGRVWLVERVPDAQRRPLDVATEDAAGDLGEARSTVGELAPELGIQLHVQRRSAFTPDFVRVRLVIVKDDRATGADALLPSRALDVAAASTYVKKGAACPCSGSWATGS